MTGKDKCCKKYVQLHNGYKMPSIGLGTFTSSPEEMDLAVTTAVAEGYRQIDTAFFYQNEKAIGDTLKRIFDAGTVKRQDLFIVTKLPQIAMRAEDVEVYLKKSLAALQLDYLDLYLIHLPIGFVNKGDEQLVPFDAEGNVLIDVTTNHVAIWKAMEAMVDKGLVRSIGLSNFNIRQIQRVLDNCRIKPANLQVECHAYFRQAELFAFCQKNDISFTAYAPIGSPALGQFMEKLTGQVIEVPPLLSDPKVVAIAERHKKSSAQVLLRWLIQRGMAVIPKSTNPKRIKDNIKIFDFELTPADMKEIDSLDRNFRIFSMESLKGVSLHPECPY